MLYSFFIFKSIRILQMKIEYKYQNQTSFLVVGPSKNWKWKQKQCFFQLTEQALKLFNFLLYKFDQLHNPVSTSMMRGLMSKADDFINRFKQQFE